MTEIASRLAQVELLIKGELIWQLAELELRGVGSAGGCHSDRPENDSSFPPISCKFAIHH